MSSLREELLKSIESAKAEADEETPDTGAGDVENSASAVEEGTAEAESEVDDTEEKPAKGRSQSLDERARDEQGRFAREKARKAAEAKAAKEAAAKKPEPGEKPAPTGNVSKAAAKPGEDGKPPVDEAKPEPLKAPGSWKPDMREKWGTLPPDMQQEIDRRERETTKVLQESTAARQLAKEFYGVVSPYEGMLRAEGRHPLRAVAELLQTEQQLRTAPPGDKAQLVANIIKRFGVPIEALDSALAGEAAPQQQGGEYRDPRVDQLMEQLQRQQQQQLEASARDNRSKIDTFLATKPEFFEDVKNDMADWIELAESKGRAMSLEEAYKRACREHPDVSKVLDQREKAKAANATQASTQRARAASSSVRHEPAGSVTAPQPTSLRAQLEAAVAQSRGR